MNLAHGLPLLGLQPLERHHDGAGQAKDDGGSSRDSGPGPAQRPWELVAVLHRFGNW